MKSGFFFWLLQQPLKSLLLNHGYNSKNFYSLYNEISRNPH